MGGTCFVFLIFIFYSTSHPLIGVVILIIIIRTAVEGHHLFGSGKVLAACCEYGGISLFLSSL